MRDYDSATYGQRMAGTYDWFIGDVGEESDTEALVSFLRTEAPDGPALELGVGTGRVAIPLARDGLEVVGIDASEAMLATLRDKPGGHLVHPICCDFADFDLGRRFKLVYAVFRTFFMLTTQEAQICCLQCVRRHLEPDGILVMDASGLDPAHFGDQVEVRSIGVDSLVVTFMRHDIAAQTLDRQNVVVDGSGVRLFPARMRYAWPPELDLMARVAGLSLRRRWQDWTRSPFVTPTRNFVSVYGPGPA